MNLGAHGLKENEQVIYVRRVLLEMNAKWRRGDIGLVYKYKESKGFILLVLPPRASLGASVGYEQPSNDRIVLISINRTFHPLSSLFYVFLIIIWYPVYLSRGSFQAFLLAAWQELMFCLMNWFWMEIKYRI